MKRSLFALLCLFGTSEAAIEKAKAEIHPTAGNHAEGTVTFQVERGGVRVIADIKGLTPGLHGFHIHEKGDCSSPDGSSAGGHFNPDQKPHAGPDSESRHVGDLGNLFADEKGVGSYNRLDTGIQLEGPSSIVGRAVIVHEKVDDFTTQPTGNAGARLGCGVIIAE